MAVDKGVWAIGDVHGCVKTLRALMKQIQPRIAYTLGDYIDRGPDSKGVLDYIMRDTRIRPLTGNHEDMFLQVYDSPSPSMIAWFLDNGGAATLESFGVEHISQVPERYVEWLRALPIARRYGKVVLSHAGPNLNKDDPYSDRKFILWNRKVKPPKNKKWTIVVGHTVVGIINTELSVETRKVMIDTGCVRGGHLTAYNIHTQQLVHMPCKD